MTITTELHGDEITITVTRIASYGRPPEWRAEFSLWPSIDAREFAMWPDSRFTNIRAEARYLMEQSERDCSVD